MVGLSTGRFMFVLLLVVCGRVVVGVGRVAAAAVAVAAVVAAAAVGSRDSGGVPAAVDGPLSQDCWHSHYCFDCCNCHLQI